MTERLSLALAKLRRRQTLDFRDKKFPLQDAFVVDPSQFLVAQCSRRAGKSNGLAIRFFRALAKYPGCYCPYIALTHSSARNIMWPVLQEQDEIFKVGFKFRESDLTAKHPNGSTLQLLGANTEGFIKRIKGIKTPAAAVDEAQDAGRHLKSLIDDVLTPAIADYEGSWIALTGTPGPVPRGYFFDVTEGKKYGYSIHKWTLFDNPYLPNARKFVSELKLKQEWDDQNPTYRREYLNEWVLDVESLLIKYAPEKNDYTELPRGHWNYILGIDIGFRDSDALVVLAWSESTSSIYLVEEAVTATQDITALANQISDFQRRYDIQKIVMDTGGLGLKIAEELTRRKQIPVMAADKKRKFENVAFLNDWLRLGKFKAKRDSRFALDSYQVQIDWEKTTPDRLVVRDSFHSDVIDAVLYAFRESPAFTFQPAKEKPKYGTTAWAEAEEDSMLQEEIDRAEQDNANQDWGW